MRSRLASVLRPPVLERRCLAHSKGTGLLTTMLGDFSGSPYFAITSTFRDARVPVANKVNYLGATTDGYSQGKSLSDNGVKAVVSAAISSGRLPKNPNAVYFVLTSRDVSETSGFLTRYCGWHSHATISTFDIKYAFVGDPSTGLAACSAQPVGPNGAVYAGADAMASVVAHELEETVSDPDLNAWYDASGAENADKCAWTYGVAVSSGTSNMTLGGTRFLIQQNWNATTQGCALTA